MAIGGLDGHLVPDRAAWLDDGAHTGIDQHLDVDVTEVDPGRVTVGDPATGLAAADRVDPVARERRAGAQFLVSPGTTPGLLRECTSGTSTPSSGS